MEGVGHFGRLLGEGRRADRCEQFDEPDVLSRLA